MTTCPMDGRPCPLCPTRCRFVYGDEADTTRRAADRDADRQAREETVVDEAGSGVAA